MAARIYVPPRYLGHVPVNFEATYRRNELRTWHSRPGSKSVRRNFPDGMNSHHHRPPPVSSDRSLASTSVFDGADTRIACESSCSAAPCIDSHERRSCLSSSLPRKPNWLRCEGHRANVAGYVTVRSRSISPDVFTYRRCVRVLKISPSTSPIGRIRSLAAGLLQIARINNRASLLA